MERRRGLRWRRLVVCCVIALAGVHGGESGAAGDWAEWTKRPGPVFEGQVVASDPAIVRDGALYRMFYSCFVYDPAAATWDPAKVLIAICQATSRDGFAWENVPAEGPIEGLVLQGREGEWDEDLEGAFVVRRDGAWLLYYSGYRHGEGNPAQGFPAALAVARSTDGVHFERVGDGPILAPTPGWYDNDAVYSPAIVEHGDELVMIYAGHCYTRCDHGWGVHLLAATSRDGLTWTKRPEPVLAPMADLPWTRDGVAEPGLLVGPDGFFYLFFTSVKDADRWIGVARGATPFGPWEVNPDPILLPSPDGFDRAGVLAPDVHLEGETVRMWFLGATPEEDIAIGYAEARWPLWR